MKNIAPAIALSLGLGFAGAANATCTSGCPGSSNGGTNVDTTVTTNVRQDQNVSVVAKPTAISGSVSGAAATIEKGAVQNTVAPVIKGSTANATIEKGAVTVAPVIAPVIQGSTIQKGAVQNDVNAAATIEKGAVQNAVNAAATIEKGAVQTDNTNLNNNKNDNSNNNNNDNKSTASSTTGPVTVHGNTTIYKQVRQAPMAYAPSMPMQAGSVSVVGGRLADQNAVVECSKVPKSGSVISLGLSTPVGGISGGRTPGVVGIDGAVEKQTVTDIDGVEHEVLVDKTGCVNDIKEDQRINRAYNAGGAAQAVVIAADINASPALQGGRDALREVKCTSGDLVTNMIMGTCPAEPVTENVKKFTGAAVGAPAAPAAPQGGFVCPAGTKREGKAPLYNNQIKGYICG